MSNVGAAVRGRRNGLKISQSELAVAAGVSRKFISEVEAGKDTVEIGKLLALLGALDLRLELSTTKTRDNGEEAPHPKVRMDLDAILGDYLADNS